MISVLGTGKLWDGFENFLRMNVLSSSLSYDECFLVPGNDLNSARHKVNQVKRWISLRIPSTIHVFNSLASIQARWRWSSRRPSMLRSHTFLGSLATSPSWWAPSWPSSCSHPPSSPPHSHPSLVSILWTHYNYKLAKSQGYVKSYNLHNHTLLSVSISMSLT